MTVNFTRLKYIFGKINYSQRCRKLGQRPKSTRAMHYVIYLPTLSIDSNKEEHHFKRFVGWLSPFRLDEYGVGVGGDHSLLVQLQKLARSCISCRNSFPSIFLFKQDDGMDVTFCLQLPSPRKLIFYLTMSGWLITAPSSRHYFLQTLRHGLKHNLYVSHGQNCGKSQH